MFTNATHEPKPTSTTTVQEQLEALQQQLEHSFCCPITLQIMAEPCIADDGHTYEKEAIEKIINSGEGVSPITGERITSNKLIPNHSMTSAISKYLETNLQLYDQDRVYLPNSWIQQLVNSITSHKHDRVKRLIARDPRLLEYSFSPAITHLRQPYTTLQLACELGTPAIITDLLVALYTKNQLTMLAPPPANFNPEALNELLQEALEKNEAKEFLALLIKAGAVVEDQDPAFGNTLLHDFVIQGKVAAVDWLLQHGACLERKNDRGDTALLLAVAIGHTHLVEFLLAQSANPQATNSEQQSAVLLAFMHNHPQIIPLLVGSKKAKLPPLHLALKLNDHNLFEFLLTQPNVDLNAVDEQQQTPLHSAISRNNIAAVKLLLAKGVTPNATYGEQQFTMLHLAVMRGNLDMVNLLLTVPVKVDSLTTNNDTALHLAAIKGKDDIVALLLKAGANHKIHNNQNQTPAESARSKHKHKTAAVIEQEVMDLKRANTNKVTELLTKISQLQSTVVALDVRERAHNARNVEAFMIQFKTSTSPATQKEKLTAFLKYVVNGKQRQAEAMLRDNPVLALIPGDITDHAGRTFKGITGFQLAVWALDWEMWTMIENYLPEEVARLQAEKFSSGPWVKAPNIGEHFDITQLLANMQTYIDIYRECDDQEREEYWIKNVGKEQHKLPIHILQHYCDPRPFDPIPKFDHSYTALTRKMNIDLSKLGVEFGIVRGRNSEWNKNAQMAVFVPKQMTRSTSDEGLWIDMHPSVITDCALLENLYCTRLQQRKKLMRKLTPGLRQKLGVR